MTDLSQEIAALRVETRALRERLRHTWAAIQNTSIGGGTSGGPRLTILTFDNGLCVSDNPYRIYNNTGGSITITQVFLAVDTAPGGQAVIVDIHKNGVTIFTDQDHRPQIADGALTGQSSNIDVATWADGEYITAHTDQVGSTVRGADLVVHVIHNR